MQATSLPFIVAATAIGIELDLLTAAEGAALVGAGLLSVLVFPIVGLALLRGASLPARKNSPVMVGRSGSGDDDAARGITAPDRAAGG